MMLCDDFYGEMMLVDVYVLIGADSLDERLLNFKTGVRLLKSNNMVVKQS